MVSIAERVWEKRSQFFPLNAERQARELLVPFFTSLVWRGRGLNPRPPELEARTRNGRSITRLSRRFNGGRLDQNFDFYRNKMLPHADNRENIVDHRAFSFDRIFVKLADKKEMD